MRRLRSKRGYTAVEVLSSMVLLAIGAAGVIGMQKVTISGGMDARRFDIASNIANEWAEILQRDASFWVGPNALGSSQNNIGQTKYLQDVLSGSCNGTTWCLPLVGAGRNVLATSNASGCSGATPSAASCVDTYAYDSIGRPLNVSFVAGNIDTAATFCVQYRLNYLADNCTPGPCVTTDPQELIRAEIRVFYQRLEYGAIGDCAALPGVAPDTMPAAASRYHFVYLSTLVRRNPLQ